MFAFILLRILTSLLVTTLLVTNLLVIDDAILAYVPVLQFFNLLLTLEGLEDLTKAFLCCIFVDVKHKTTNKKLKTNETILIFCRTRCDVLPRMCNQ